jgi:hypothetical protein
MRELVEWSKEDDPWVDEAEQRLQIEVTAISAAMPKGGMCQGL